MTVSIVQTNRRRRIFKLERGKTILITIRRNWYKSFVMEVGWKRVGCVFFNQFEFAKIIYLSISYPIFSDDSSITSHRMQGDHTK